MIPRISQLFAEYTLTHSGTENARSNITGTFIIISSTQAGGGYYNAKQYNWQKDKIIYNQQ